MDEDGGAARFAHLLQPIRDLAQNWEIDIASLLADYLEEIDKIAITFDGGVTTMNFAEAALLIQGSASIYSKKIEYLYALVYQTLNLLASNKQMEQGLSVDEAGRDKDTTFDKHKRKGEDFLALDDIKQGRIDLGDAEMTSKPVATLPRAPFALIPLSEAEKKNNALLSRSGDLLGSRKDFRMNTCTCHCSGALLMDYADLALIPRVLTPPPQVLLAEDDAMRHGEPAEGQILWAEDDPVDRSMVMDVPQPVLEDPNELDATFPSPAKETAAETGDAPAPQRERRTRMAAQQTNAPPTRDPWEVLDPHETSSQAESKAFRRGRPFRVPAVLSKKASSKKRGHDGDKGEEDAVSSLMPLMEFCRLAFHSQSSRFPTNFLKAPSFADFEELFWAEQKRRRQLMRKERELRQAMMSRDDEVYAYDDDKEYSDDEDNPHVAFQPGMSDIGATTAQASAHVGPAGGDGDEVDDDGGFADEGGVFSDLAQSTQPTDGIPPIMIDDNALSQFVVSSYEDLVRQHVEGFITSANQYLKESDLARRVREWEEKIKPVLDEEETHPPYDIHAYGWQVLQGFQDSENTEKVDFARIASGKQQFEVCRLFLASLQLANNRNVDIVCGSDDRNSMQMRLLQTEQIHTKLEQYQAPSLTGKT